MPIYLNKPAFLAEGVKSCPAPDEQPDCPICEEEITSNENRLTSTHLAGFNARHGHASIMSVPCGQDAITVTAVTTLNVTHPPDQIGRRPHVSQVCCCNVFGRQCVEAWLIRKNDCPFCRVRFFPRIRPQDRLVAMVKAAVKIALRGAIGEYLEVREEWEGDGEGSDWGPDEMKMKTNMGAAILLKMKMAAMLPISL